MCQNCEFVPTNYDTIVCLECGIEKNILPNCCQLNVGYTVTHSPFQFGYSRVKRFSQMVNCLLFPAGSNQDNKMMKHLYPRRYFIRTRGDLDLYIDASGLRDKRFCSMHYFCKVFLSYIPPRVYSDLHAMSKRMCFIFEKIALQFAHRFPGKPFISYNFLMNFIIRECGFFDYLKYVKKLKCTRRKRVYCDLLNQLGFTANIHV